MVATDRFSLERQVAFVTGAASGIGRRIALGFAEAGADVACFDRDREGAEAAAEEIRTLGRNALGLGGDVTDAPAMNRCVARVSSELGPLTVACNAAGIANATPAEDMDPEIFREVIEINVTGVFISCQAQARAMLAMHGGSIVNIASMSGTIANYQLTQAHYNASKAAVVHLSKSLAMEWARRGVRVNSLSPGYTLTPMNDRVEVRDRLKLYAETTPLGRIASVDDMVGPAIFLASSASSFCTGIDLLVDGGYVVW